MNGIVASLGGSWTAQAGDGLLQLGAGLDHQPGRDSAFASADIRHPFGSIAGDLAHTRDDRSASSQFTAGFRTTVAARGGKMELAGKATTESVILVKVAGASETHRFEVLVDGQVAARLRGGQSVPIALPAYRAYAVRIRPAGPELISYGPASKAVSLFPGTVAYLEWASAPIQVQFGRLLDGTGAPVAQASIHGRSTWSETDENGRFQIEAEAGAQVTVTSREGKPLVLALPIAPGRIARLGDLRCCDAPPIRADLSGRTAISHLEKRQRNPVMPSPRCLRAGVALTTAVPAAAELLLSQVIVDLTPDAPAREDIEVVNLGEERMYVLAAPFEILNPESDHEERVDAQDPDRSGLLVSPRRVILEPSERRTIRIATSGPRPARERVFRIAIQPVAGDVRASRSALKVFVGYDALVLLRPAASVGDIHARRGDNELTLRNEGNTSVEIYKGEQCEERGAQCRPLPGKRLYPGTEWHQVLPYATSVRYQMARGAESSERTF